MLAHRKLNTKKPPGMHPLFLLLPELQHSSSLSKREISAFTERKEEEKEGVTSMKRDIRESGR